MNSHVEKLGQVTLLVAQGRLDFAAAAPFQAQIGQVMAGAGGAGAAVVIDCEGLEYVSSAGLRAFLLAARNAQRSGLNFSVCALQHAVREVFELSGFSRVMAVHPDRATALAAATQKPA
jgi:anti-anti-sigma factor